MTSLMKTLTQPLTKTLSLFALIALVLTLSSHAKARSAVPDMSVYLDQQLTLMESSAIGKIPNPAAPADDEADAPFFLRRFWLRVRPKAIFSLPGLVKIQIIPELEMLWERPLPEGWTGYKK